MACNGTSLEGCACFSEGSHKRETQISGAADRHFHDVLRRLHDACGQGLVGMKVIGSVNLGFVLSPSTIRCPGCLRSSMAASRCSGSIRWPRVRYWTLLEECRNETMLGILLTALGMTYWAARRTTTTGAFYAADSGLTTAQNGLALAGDRASAAAFLGYTGLTALRQQFHEMPLNKTVISALRLHP